MIILNNYQIIMIYRREQPTTPVKRFRSVILNPTGTKIKHKFAYLMKQNTNGRSFGTKVCLRRRKCSYIAKFNFLHGITKNKYFVIYEISLARRYQTFIGLIKFSDGSLSCLPLASGAHLGDLGKVCIYQSTPKLFFFSYFKAGSVVPVAYLSINACIFNIMYEKNSFAWIARAGGTFCIVIRMNAERGYCIIKAPSKKFFRLQEACYVMLGRNSNTLPKGIWLGKAGTNIKRGFRPAVRGVAKNPVDHPHGGRTKSNSPERTPWGKIAKYNK